LFGSFSLWNLGRLKNGKEILFYTKPLKDRGFLWEKPHPKASSLIYREPRNILTFKTNRSALRSYETDDHSKGRRLPCSITTKKPHDLPSIYRERDPIDHLAAAINLCDLFHFE
jgi:hypothetical protein